MPPLNSRTFACSNAKSLSTKNGKVYKHFNCVKSFHFPLHLPSCAPPPSSLYSSSHFGLCFLPLSQASRPSRGHSFGSKGALRCQQGKERLIETLLLFYAASVGLHLKIPWHPCAAAHQSLHRLAHSLQNAINNQAHEELRFQHTFPNHEGLWMHAERKTMQS